MQTKQDTIRALIEAHKGKYFSVEFIKKDGSLRSMVARHAYKAGHDGYNTVASKPEYITLIEGKQDGSGDLGDSSKSYNFRNVNMQAIKRLKIAGKEFLFD